VSTAFEEPEAVEPFELEPVAQEPQPVDEFEPELEAAEAVSTALEEPEPAEPFELEPVAQEPQPLDELEPELEAAEAVSSALEELEAAEPFELEPVAQELQPALEEAAETPGLRFGMDPALFEIFESECREHLRTLADLVESCHQEPGVCTISEQAARAFHTLHGSAHMAAVEPMATVGSALEHLVNELRLNAIPADGRVIELINDGRLVMNQLLDSIAAPDVELPETDGLLRRITELQEELIAERVAAQAKVKAIAEREASDASFVDISGDPELMEIFLEEARDLLEMLDASLREWRSNPAESKVLMELQRTLHTLKGGARLAGIMPVGDLSHAYETLLTGVVSGEVQPSPEVLELAQDTTDWLSSQLEEVASAHRVRSADALIAMLEAARAGKLSELAAELAPAAAAEPVEAFAPRQVQHPQQEQIRVRADFLDRLVNNAGEVSIYRSRIDQQSTSIG